MKIGTTPTAILTDKHLTVTKLLFRDSLMNIALLRNYWVWPYKSDPRHVQLSGTPQTKRREHKNAYLLHTIHKGLSPCDFHLIPMMKEPLRGIRFRTVSEILQAVDRSIRTINTTGAAKGILRLPHRWQRIVHNAGDYTEGQ